MKKTSMLSAASAVAILAISGAAFAQGQGMGAGSSGGSTGAAPGAAPGGAMQREAPAPGGAMQREAPAGGAMQNDRDRPAQAQGTPGGKDAPKANQAQGGKDMQKSNQAQDKSPAGETKQMGSDTKSGDTKQQMGSDTKSGNAKSGSTVGAAGQGSVNLTTQQRTTIRQTVLTSSAPRATNINFSINVGTVVPTSVRVVAVPATIVEINPEWRGYRYFVVNDEIIIVEPDSLRIVAVLNL